METPLAAIRHLTKAWMRKDAEEMSRRLTADIVEIGPAFASALAGKKDFFRKYEAYLNGPERVVTYRILRPRTLKLSPRLALVYFSYTMRKTDGNGVEDTHGKESMLVEKSHSGWRVKFIHWHQDGTGTAAAKDKET